MERFGLPKKHDAAGNEAAKRQLFIRNQSQALIQTCAFYAVIGLIVSS